MPTNEGAGRRPLHVALVAEAAGGGVGVHVADLIRGLSAAGVAVHAILPSGERLDPSIFDSRVLDCCAGVLHVPMRQAPAMSDALSWLRIYRQLLRIRPDIVHSHSSKAGVLARACRGPWRQIYTPHAFYTLNPSLSQAKRRLFGGIEGALGRHFCDRVVAVSQCEATHAHEDLRMPASRVATIPNGVPGFSMLKRAAAQQSLGLDPTRFTAAFVGRFAYQKGLDRLMRVADLLQARTGRAIDIAVVGEGDFESSAARPISRLPANVRLLGPVRAARRYFSAFDALVLPSRYEGMPYVYLEAMSAGLPIVTTRVAGAEELVEREQIGLVVANTDDPRPLAWALRRLCKDATLRRSFRQNCVAATQRYTVDLMVRRTLALYHAVMHGEAK